MKISVLPLLVGGMAMSGVGNVGSAYGQPERPALGTLVERKGYELPLKNVKPHIMAWWLDPVNQPRPAEVGPPLLREGGQATRPFALPTGVEKIVALDAQKMLLVLGTEKGTRELSEVVALLDKPLRYVEIEARAVQMKPEDIKAMELEFGAFAPALPTDQVRLLPAPSFSATKFRGNLSTLLGKRANPEGRIEVVAPRVTTLNNANAFIELNHSHPAPWELQNEIALLARQPNWAAPAEVQTPLKIDLVPTINNDDTVTLLVNLNGQVQLGRKKAVGQIQMEHRHISDALMLGTPSEIISIINLQDGETVAIRGFDENFTRAFLRSQASPPVAALKDMPIINGIFQPKMAMEDDLIVFLTPRIVRTPQK